MVSSSTSFVTSVLAAAQRFHISPKQLILEILESEVIGSLTDLSSVLRDYRSTGLLFAIDDFGTGYSSLSQLRTLPFDRIKIDRSFIINMDKGEKGVAIVAAIIAMAHSLGLSVIAEGVEKKSHIDLLNMMHCDIAQGYFISHPLPARDFERMMSNPEQRSA